MLTDEYNTHAKTGYNWNGRRYDKKSQDVSIQKPTMAKAAKTGSIQHL